MRALETVKWLGEAYDFLLGANCQEDNPALLTLGICVLMVLW